LVLQRVERIVLDLPTRAIAENQVRNVRGINVPMRAPLNRLATSLSAMNSNLLNDRFRRNWDDHILRWVHQYGGYHVVAVL
jgi:hypothetical protein